MDLASRALTGQTAGFAQDALNLIKDDLNVGSILSSMPNFGDKESTIDQKVLKATQRDELLFQLRLQLSLIIKRKLESVMIVQLATVQHENRIAWFQGLMTNLLGARLEWDSDCPITDSWCWSDGFGSEGNDCLYKIKV